jgi:competence protein ComEA
MVLGAVVFGWWWGGRSPEPTAVVSAATTAHVADKDTITVHVAGWVASPGLVELAADSRVAGAIVAAGGALPGARIEAINLAAPIADGMQIIVPGPDDPAIDESSPERSSDGRIQLNRATAIELDDLPGIGPVIAERIVAYRTANGPFSTIEDLLAVPGIGEAKLASLRDLVIVP